jgi:argininosuccinate lyase
MSRFRKDPDPRFWRLNRSIEFDWRLAPYDIDQSQAHARGLCQIGVLSDEELESIDAGLEKVHARMGEHGFEFEEADEDIHMAVERLLGEEIGPLAGKLHTGRSRNDQVATDVAMVVQAHSLRAIELAGATMEQLLVLADRHHDWPMPGYTHLQRAQPVLLGHHLLAHFWALARDVERWQATLARADVSPLGAGALAGSSLPLDPAFVADELGFARPFENSLDAVSDRDFVAEALFTAALTQVHLSRLGEEIVLWSSDEFGFLVLSDAHSTGSSMLPQKKNPDVAELARGSAGRLIGHLTGLLATLKGLPLAYNRDLQGDKEPLFDALDTCGRALTALTGLLATATFVRERMQAAADTPATAATDLAEMLVEQGVPFREAHVAVGALVRQATERGVPLAELVMTDPRLGPDALALLEPGQAVQRRTTPGGAGPKPLKRQLTEARGRLKEQRGWLGR